MTVSVCNAHTTLYDRLSSSDVRQAFQPVDSEQVRFTVRQAFQPVDCESARFAIRHTFQSIVSEQAGKPVLHLLTGWKVCSTSIKKACSTLRSQMPFPPVALGSPYRLSLLSAAEGAPDIGRCT